MNETKKLQLEALRAVKPPPPQGEFDYLADAKARLGAAQGRLTIRLSDTKLSPWSDTGKFDGAYRPHFRCTIKGPGGSHTFDFWGSIRDGEQHRHVNEYDVLACLTWDCSEDFPEFCAEFGYNTDSIKAHKTWKACLAQTRALHRVFPCGEDRLSLAQIQ